MEIKVNLISIKNGSLKTHLEMYNEQNGDSYTTCYENSQPAHEDAIAALQNLRYHVEKIMHAEIDAVAIDGYYKQTSGNSELLTIYAHLESEEFSSPTNLAVRVHLGKDEYEYIDRLEADLSLCEHEILLYIKQGKRLGIEEFVTMSIIDKKEDAA